MIVLSITQDINNNNHNDNNHQRHRQHRQQCRHQHKGCRDVHQNSQGVWVLIVMETSALTLQSWMEKGANIVWLETKKRNVIRATKIAIFASVGFCVPSIIVDQCVLVWTNPSFSIHINCKPLCKKFYKSFYVK